MPGKNCLIGLMAVLLAVCLFPLHSTGETQASDAVIRIDGVRVAFFSNNDEYLTPVEQDGLLYVPAASLGENLGIRTETDPDTLAVMVNGVRTAFFDENEAYIPAVNIDGTVYVPLEAFLRSVGIAVQKEGNAYLISRGTVSEQNARTETETVPESWWIQLDKDNFSTYFAVSFQQGDTLSWKTETNGITFMHWSKNLTLRCTARTGYEYKNVSFRVTASPNAYGQSYNAGTMDFGYITMPQSGELTRTEQYSTLQITSYPPDKSTPVFLGASVAGAGGEIRVPYQEAQEIYEKGTQALEQEKYETACTFFRSLGDFRDAPVLMGQAEETIKNRQDAIDGENYGKAMEAMDAGDFDTAISLLEQLSLNQYGDSSVQLEAAQKAKKDKAYDNAMTLLDNGDYDEAIAAFETMEGYRDSKEQIQVAQDRKEQNRLNNLYEEAEKLLEAGEFDKAIEAFKGLGSFRDSAERVSNAETMKLQNQYERAEALLQEHYYDEAVKMFEKLGDFSDSAKRATDAREQKKQYWYDWAGKLLNQKKYQDAYKLYREILDYQDVAEIIEKDEELARLHFDDIYSVGSSVFFGSYRDQALQWGIIERNEEKAFLLLIDPITDQIYHEKETTVTWANCSLRKWLNSTFFKEAFSKDQQKVVLTTAVDNSKSQINSQETWMEILPCAGTKDRLYLPSAREIETHIKPIRQLIDQTDKMIYLTTRNTRYSKERKYSGIEVIKVDISPIFAYKSPVNQKTNLNPVMWVDLNKLDAIK